MSIKLLSFIDCPYDRNLPMTRIATREALDLVLLNQLSPEGKLVARGSVNGVKDIFLGPDVQLRVFMAINAPPHIKRVASPGDGHPADLSVARRTADSLVDMNAVVEIDKIGKGVHSRPQDGLIGSVAFPNGFQYCGVSPNL
jgi:hypothetical protein